MKRFLVLLLDIISFGSTFVIRMLVKKKILRNRYDIDVNGDGDTDISININSDNCSKEE